MRHRPQVCYEVQSVNKQRLHCLGGDGHLIYTCENTFGFSRVLMCNGAECRAVAA